MSPNHKHLQPRLDRLSDALESGALDQARRMLNRGLAPVDVAHLLESTPPRERNVLWELVDADLQGDVLQYLGDDIQSEFLGRMDAEQLVSATEGLDVDDLADLLQRLPNTVIHEVLQAMEAQERQRIETVLSYPEDTAGGLMNTDTITIRPDITLDVVLRYLRRHEKLPDSTDTLLVVTRRDELIGTLPLNLLLVSDPSILVREVMNTDFPTIQATAADTEVASLFEKFDLISAPVVSTDGALLGRITIDDVVDVIREDAEHQVMSMAGLDEDEDTFAPAWRTGRRRAVWLGINLVAATIVSFAIGIFESTIQQITALAVLMPIVSSMGGIAGSQTLTVLIRGIALGHVGGANVRWLLVREMLSGMMNGVLWAVIVALVAIVRFDDYKLGGIIALAMVINLTIAALAGTLIPVLLKRLKIDPALSGGVLLTTITDVVGFVAFLGLAAAFY
ncbi:MULTISPECIES: magnesium transporter [Chromohalobacter]|uniref:Magnesium transporter MgtE n=1 Tax=Chromohalobacter israelensis (strain ATCC BAA-138 / DSM 3043 / CIP 106854 / NCIMB 13768 / 1H11) TaxID=290398 RepID=Q1QVC6_CHRI1|nr:MULTISPECIES: magnesium transporter [Chromohalobacter]ABE59582.1 magnesium transporter [Chromohalobacter salexigens DSM 3043]MBZ5874648.1 magnesium transporter [Chromohalobacter salexigens]MDO0946273.1 magnesium transporter [Chromohalobacter salexigens]NQY46069.1 magnesium transporter [Chromohalobacter sp.]NWO56983.1 magnesium transporter [Chromohalobacter salexigens]